jgi:c-di-GMP-binding flagellar brake protein YcgR
MLKVDNFKVIRFLLTDKGERTQRSDFFRFNCAIQTKFTVISRKDGEDTSAAMMDGLIRDLGGGGMKMYSKHEVWENALIRMMLQLNDDFVMIFGEVLHKKHDSNGTLPFQYGVKFTAVAKNDQEKIIQFLYNEQRKSLQRAR